MIWRRVTVLIVAAIAAFFAAANADAADWRGSFDASYQAAQPGETIVVPVGTISGDQVINYRASLANLPVPCTPTQTASCVKFVMAGPVTVNGVVEIHGSSVWIQGGNQLRVNGYIDTEATSDTQHPDHVIVEGTSSVSAGVFNADTVTFRNMDVGPATAYYSGGASPMTCCREGRGFENKIGFAGGASYVPKNVTFDGVRIHDQNGDSTRLQGGADVHFGGLFVVTVDGLTVKDSVFEANVVYHVQIQNFEGPKAKRVVFDHNSFSCPVDWLYAFGCDNQRAIQFDYDPGTEFALTNNVAANGSNGLFGCYVGTCGGLVGVKASGNVNLANSTTAPPLLGGPPPPPAACSDTVDNDGDGRIDYPADQGCSSASDNDETDPVQPPPVCPGTALALTVVSQTATTVTLGWAPPNGAEWYTFWTAASPASTPVRVSNGPAVLANGSVRNTVRFAKVPAGGCYRVQALIPGPDGGYGG